MSDESLSSPAVLEEIRLAVELEKPMRPLVVARLSKALPACLARLHYINLAPLSPAERERSIKSLITPIDMRLDASDAEIKLAACRSV